MALDEVTRTEMIEIAKESCALKAVLKKEKPCPSFGPSESCEDCSHNWVTMVNLMMKRAKIRRSAYEAEREKVKVLTSKIEEMREKVDPLLGLVRNVARGFRSVAEIGELIIETFVNELNKRDNQGKKDGKSQGMDRSSEKGRHGE